MHLVSLPDTEALLAEPIDEVAGGQEVIITRHDGTAFKLVPVEPLTPKPRYGSAHGLIEMAEDLDEPLADFEAYQTERQP